MLEPPFLELEFYVGTNHLEEALHQLVDGIRPGVVPRKLVVPACPSARPQGSPIAHHPAHSGA